MLEGILSITQDGSLPIIGGIISGFILTIVFFLLQYAYGAGRKVEKVKEVTRARCVLGLQAKKETTSYSESYFRTYYRDELAVPVDVLYEVWRDGSKKAPKDTWPSLIHTPETNDYKTRDRLEWYNQYVKALHNRLEKWRFLYSFPLNIPLVIVEIGYFFEQFCITQVALITSFHNLRKSQSFLYGFSLSDLKYLCTLCDLIKELVAVTDAVMEENINEKVNPSEKEYCCLKFSKYPEIRPAENLKEYQKRKLNVASIKLHKAWRRWCARLISSGNKRGDQCTC